MAGFDAEAARRGIVREIRRRGKPGGDPWLQHYVGSPLPALGLSVPVHRGILKAFHREHRGLAAREVNRLAAALWRKARVHEERGAAIEILSLYRRVLDEASWRLADSWVEEATGWGLSDSLAAGPIATMLSARPSRFREVLRWTRSESLWRRRAATYALRGFVSAGELDRPLRLLERLLYDEEFWVRRAVGTWLRECWKKDRRRTEAFLRKHVRGLPRVTITVATERAPKAFREELRREAGARTPPPS